MDDTVAGHDVGDDNFGVIDEDFDIFHCDSYFLAQDALRFPQVNDIFCHDLASHYVVEQNVGQFLFVFR